MKPFNDDIFHKLCCPCVILYVKNACNVATLALGSRLRQGLAKVQTCKGVGQE